MRIAKLSSLALAIAGLGLMIAAGPAIAQEAVKTVGKTSTDKNKMIPSLAVLNSKGASLKDGVLTMTGIAPNSIIFADRPYRAAGHTSTAEFIGQWGEGKDSFAADPPNATISVLDGDSDTIDDAVIVLKNPKLEGDTLTFEVSVLEGELKSADGPASLFIDWFAVHGGGVYRGAGFHGGWYGHPGAFVAGAAVGAAVASPYYHPYYPPPACGYYPYPPCY